MKQFTSNGEFLNDKKTDRYFTCVNKSESDTFFELSNGRISYNSKTLFDQSIRFIEEVQLLNREMWENFVRQFGFNPDDEDKGWRCEYWGKMMRGACFTYKYTRNPSLYAVLTDAVRGLLKQQDENGRFSTYSVDCEFTGWDMWGRKYVMLGLQYFYEICSDETLKQDILTAMCKHADYIINRIGRREEGKLPITDASGNWKGLNSSSILEPFVRLYCMTKMKKYLDFAEYIVDNGGFSDGSIFELAYEGKLYPYQYPVIKAYEMMSCFEGLLEYYRVTRIPKHLTAVSNFVDLIIQSDITIIGCAGCTHELFDNSVVKQTDSSYQGVMQETCVTVTWMKLCHKLLCLNGDPKLADQIELSIYNALAGAINTEGSTNNGGLPFDSYSPLLPNKRGRKIGGLKKMDNGSIYGCCAAIGAAGTGLIGLTGVMSTPDGICFNLYGKGTVITSSPAEQELQFVVETNYPVSGSVDIHLTIENKEEFSIYLRIPNWSIANSVTVNGNQITDIQNGSYLKIKRVWKNNDKISLSLDLSTQLIRSTDLNYSDENLSKEGYIALKRGPIILARDARLGEDIREAVEIETDTEGHVITIPSKDASFETMMEFLVPVKSGKQIHVIDYASAGKTWDINSETAAWFPVNNKG